MELFGMKLKWGNCGRDGMEMIKKVKTSKTRNADDITGRRLK